MLSLSKKSLFALLILFISCEASSSPSARSDTGNDDSMNKDKESRVVKIIVGDQTFEAELVDSQSARNFASKLPLDLTMEDLSENEKYFQFREKIAAEDSKPFPQINTGDLMIYQGRYIVLFYKTFTQRTYEYVKIGNIKDTSGLAEAIGTGRVEIRWE